MTINGGDHGESALRALDPLNWLAATLHAEVERIWPTPGGCDMAERQALALCEEVGEIARALLKRSHARRSPDGFHKGKTVDEWTANLAVEISQTIGVALQLAHVEGLDVDAEMENTVAALVARPCILDASAADDNEPDEAELPDPCDTFSESGASGLCGWCSRLEAEHPKAARIGGRAE